MYRLGSQWRGAFSSTLNWTPLDYPLMLPVSQLRLWVWIGHESRLASIVLGLLFYLALLLILAGGAAWLWGKKSGLLALLLLLCSTGLVQYAAWQYADVPLACFIAGTILCLLLAHDCDSNTIWFSFLAGLFAGLAAWTKNEGLPFAVLCGGTVLLCLLASRREARRINASILAGFVLGIMLVAPVLIGFRHLLSSSNWLFDRSASNAYQPCWLAPENPLLTSRPLSGEWLEYFLERTRYIFGTSARMLFIGRASAGYIPLCLCLLLTLPIAIRRSPPVSGFLVAITLLPMSGLILAYFLAYLTSPYQLDWHIKYSANRLLLHILPLAVLIISAGACGRLEVRET
jgi:4-amino-4-deoxy-L-arabinose transferase-like glycosyltransferase